MIHRPRLSRTPGALDARITKTVERYAATRMRCDHAAMIAKYGRVRIANLKRTARSRMRARVDRERMALIGKLRANKVCPDEYWEATMLARIRRGRARYASFADRLPRI